MKALRILVEGIVQGVGYRWFATREAGRLGIAGWVRNLPDGRVEIHAEGTAEALEAFLLSAGRGPASGNVTRVTAEPAAFMGAGGFEVRR